MHLQYILCFSDCHDSTCAFPTDCYDSTCVFLIVMLILMYALFYSTYVYLSVCEMLSYQCMHLQCLCIFFVFFIIIILNFHLGFLSCWYWCVHLLYLCFFDCQVDFDNVPHCKFIIILWGIVLYKSYYYYKFCFLHLLPWYLPWLTLTNSWLVCLPSWAGGLLSSSSELAEGTILELSSLL